MTIDEIEYPPIAELSKPQRRVLGALVEKAFTTPEYYPLTLKALTAGCNQKSNRDPVSNYSEEQVLEVVEELRQLGLAAVVHTESGRTERYRHYMRRRFTFTEPQLAILTELLLRGRQQLGELRSRASRMAPIDSLEQLRDELVGLQQMNYVQSSGPLDRRGVEVDHNLYPRGESEQARWGGAAARHGEGETGRGGEGERGARSGERGALPAEVSAVGGAAQAAVPPAASAVASSDLVERLRVVEATCEELRNEGRQRREEAETLSEALRQLGERFEELKRDLGG